MIIKSIDCTACEACIQVCPKQCIRLVEDEYGFLYPNVDADKCINCGLCDKVCHLNSKLENKSPINYIGCIHKSKDVLNNSTSGGAFTAIAENILSRNGVVYGCEYIGSMDAYHSRIENMFSIHRLQGSKYVQSRIGTAYINAKRDLLNNRLVFFVGTPCQIAGLKAFLGKEYKNLITADIICHGVPSQAYFKKFVEWYQKKNNCKVIKVDFRSKENSGWSCSGINYIIRNNTIAKEKFYYYNNYYYYYFLSGEIYRDSCYHCRYANLNRPGDFTLGDLWGVEGINLSFDTTSGCSLVLINTDNASKLLTKLNIYRSDIEVNFAIRNNMQLNHPSKFTSLRKILLEEYKYCTGDEIQENFLKRFKLMRYKARLKYMIPASVRYIILKIWYIIAIRLEK